ncbi:hypothetical protein E0H46_31980 [Rhizobium leguminosarum bv. viciae]|nr:hypothetical protein E0H46_31980 [Rhizobium leguminosarum bv. viciae]
MTIETELPAVKVPELPFEEYRRIHDIAAAAYEAATPVDYRYSALALRKAVDAAINALTLKDDPGNGEDDEVTALRARCEKAEAKLVKERSEKLHAQIDGDRHFFLKAQAAESRCAELEAELASVRAALRNEEKSYG